MSKETRRTTTPTPVSVGTIAPLALGGHPCDVFTFTSEADRKAFIAAMIKAAQSPYFPPDVNVPQYATAFDAAHNGADQFLVAVRRPDEAGPYEVRTAKEEGAERDKRDEEIQATADFLLIDYDEARRRLDRERETGFQVGDGVHWGAGTDTQSGTVVKVKGRRVFVVEDRTELLNAVNSGKPNALEFSPGGFVGHTSGFQEYAFYPGTGEPLVFSFRKKLQRFKLAGTSVNGSMRVWGLLTKGRDRHYDFNF